jgi:two-component system response regulator DevR
MPDHDVPPAPDRTTVVVAHTDVGRRATLAGMLGQPDDLELVGDCGSLVDAADLATTLVPDVLVIDRRLDGSRVEPPTGTDAFALSASIAEMLPAIRSVIVTDADSTDTGARFVASGAIGLVLDDDLDQRAVEVVRRAARGEALVTPGWTAALGAMIDGSAVPIPESLATFSDDEVAVVRALADGLDAAELAARLTVPERVVNLLVASALHKARRARRDQALLEP